MPSNNNSVCNRIPFMASTYFQCTLIASHDDATERQQMSQALTFLLNVKLLALLYHLALTLSKVTLSLSCVKILEKN